MSRESPQPDRPPRMGPRPLPLHTAVEVWITQLSCAALTLSSGVLPSWKAPGATLPQPPNLLPRALAELHPGTSAEQLDPARLIDAVTTAVRSRMNAFAAGVARYHAAPAPAYPAPPAPVWTEGAASLRFYGGGGTPVLVVPSLINRATVLDIASDRSFLRDLADAGFATYLLDWGTPAELERAFTLEDYIATVLMPAQRFVAARHAAPVHVIGYCMGGTMAVALSVLAPRTMATLTLLAAPWDFHAGSEALRNLLPQFRPFLEVIIGAQGEAPVDLLQALFATLDPTLVGRKFRAYAEMPADSDAARRFEALEDWLNDGVPLAGPVARECLFDWYGENTTGKGRWQLGNEIIDPTRIATPTLALVPAQDRIVPPASAQALVDAIPGAVARIVPFGHIGMITSTGAREQVTQPLIAWLQAQGLSRS